MPISLEDSSVPFSRTCSPETVREELYGASVHFAEYKKKKLIQYENSALLKEETSGGVQVT